LAISLGNCVRYVKSEHIGQPRQKKTPSLLGLGCGGEGSLVHWQGVTPWSDALRRMA
jgi:hypothetical protein